MAWDQSLKGVSEMNIVAEGFLMDSPSLWVTNNIKSDWLRNG